MVQRIKPSFLCEEYMGYLTISLLSNKFKPDFSLIRYRKGQC